MDNAPVKPSHVHGRGALGWQGGILRNNSLFLPTLFAAIDRSSSGTDNMEEQ